MPDSGVSVKQLAMNLSSSAFKEITWREGTERKLRSRFAAVRVRPAHRDYEKAEPHAEEWLLIEWPRSEAEPTKYWMSTLPPNTQLKALVKMAKHRWIIERDYQELKQELARISHTYRVDRAGRRREVVSVMVRPKIGIHLCNVYSAERLASRLRPENLLKTGAVGCRRA